MDLRLESMLIVSAIFSGVIVLIGIIHFFHRRACPHCGRPVMRKHLAAGFPCPKCQSTTDSASEMRQTHVVQPCVKCRSKIQCVEFWDGEVYCRDCLETADPQLWQDRLRSGIAEHVSNLTRAGTRNLLLFFAFAIVLYFAMLFAACAIAGQPQIFLNGNPAGFTIFLGTVLAWVFAVLLFAAWIDEPFVLLQRGMIYCYSTQASIAVPLSECSWREGTICGADFPAFSLWNRQRGILISIDEPAEGMPDTIAVGFTPETYQQWKQTLEFSEQAMYINLPAEPTGLFSELRQVFIEIFARKHR